VAWLRSLYDGDVAAADAGLGALVAKLRALALYDGMLIAVTADHGEEFAEHGGFEHGYTLYREMLEVPLVVHLPGGAARGTRVPALARQIDVAPTLLAALGLGVPPVMQGIPLLAAPGRVAEEALSRTSLRHDDLLALTTADWKVVHDLRRRAGPFALYALGDDPGEAHDLAAERPVVVGYGRETLLRAAAGVPRPRRGEAAVIDANTARRLRALGYVGQ